MNLLACLVSVLVVVPKVNEPPNNPWIVFHGPEAKPDSFTWAREPEDAKKNEQARKSGISSFALEGLIVALDEKSLGLTAIRTRLATLSALAKATLSDDGLIDIASLPNAEAEKLRTALLVLPEVRTSGRNALGKAFLAPSVQFTLTNGSQTVKAHWKPPLSDAAVGRYVSPPDQRSQGENPAPANPLLFAPSQLSSIGFVFGDARAPLQSKAGQVQKANQVLADLVKKLNGQLESERAAVFAKMAAGLERTYEGVLKNNQPFSNLPNELRESLSDTIANSFGAFGFGSASEASDFLGGASISSATISVTANVLVQDPNGRQHQVAVEIDLRSL